MRKSDTSTIAKFLMALQWQSGETTEEFTEKVWNITKFVQIPGAYQVHFRYTRGYHKLVISKVDVVFNGNVICTDAHTGETGCVHKDNTYRVIIDRPLIGKVQLRATVRSDGGRDSNGVIEINLIEKYLHNLGGSYKEFQREVACEILKNVNHVDVGRCCPGIIECTTANCFPVLVDGNNKSIVCAGYVESGRVVAFGHNSFLETGLLELGDNRTMLLNAISWANTSGKPVGVVKSNGTQELGGVPVDMNDDLNKYGVICVADHNIPAHRMDAVKQFLRDGGGLIVTGIGWGWAQLNPGKSLKDDNPFNRLLAEFGFLTNNDWCGNSFKTQCFDSDYHLFTVLESLSDPQKQTQLSSNLYGLVSDYLTHMPEKFRFYEQDILHSCKGSSRLGVVVENCLVKRGWYLPPSPLAAAYPGIPEETNYVTQTVSLNGSGDTSQWHSTGLFAVAGEPFTVQLQSENYGFGNVRIRIGTTTCDLSNAKELQRAPVVAFERKLRSACDAFSTPYGGLIYVILEKQASETVDFVFSHAIEAICYSKSSKNSWEKEKMKKAPMAEIIGTNLIFTVTREFALKIKNIHDFIDGWDEIVRLQDDLSCKPRSKPERICCDVQLCCGYMHSGYPIMVPVSALCDIDQVKREGAWGFFHELGHNHQSGDWTYDGAGEVTVNIFSMYVSQEFSHLDIRSVWDLKNLDAKIKKYVEEGKTYQRLKEDLCLHLGIYQRIALEFGFGAIKQFFGSFYEPGSYKPQNDNEKIQEWAKRMSRITGCNMAKVFHVWGFPVSPATLDEVKTLKDAPASLTLGLL